VDRGKQGVKRTTMTDANGIPLGAIATPANRHDSPLLVPTLEEADAWTVNGATVHLDRGYDSAVTRAGCGLIPLTGQTHQSVRQRPQEAGLVHRTADTDRGLLAGVLGGRHHRAAASSVSGEFATAGTIAHPASHEPPAYWRKL
jgi:hypothetical protein